jgi:hypothetical protein
MIQNQPHRQSPHGDSTPSVTNLVQEVRYQTSGRPRFVPTNVETALGRLQQLEGRPEREGDRVERESLIRTLVEYRDTIQQIEKRDFRPSQDLQTFQRCLFSFLDSPRTLADFHCFTRKAALPDGMRTLQDELFCRSATQFLKEIESSLIKGPLHPELAFFLDMVDATHITVPDTAGALLGTLINLYVREALADTRLIMKVYNQKHIPPRFLREAVGNLIQCGDIEEADDRFNVFILGHEVAGTPDPEFLHTARMFRSHPIAEFGFWRRRIRDLSETTATPDNHVKLCRLCDEIAGFFIYLDGVPLRSVISSLQSAVITALESRDASMGKELVHAARLILQQPWQNEITKLWNLCAYPDYTEPDQVEVSALVLEHALSSPENLSALKSQLFTRVKVGDRKAIQELKRVGETLQLVLDGECRAPSNVHTARNALDLLCESPVVAQGAISGLMRVLGIPGITLGGIGFLSFPWSTAAHPDREVREKARQLMLTLAPRIGPFALWRMEKHAS